MAEVFDKEHRTVLRSIDNMKEDVHNFVQMFKEAEAPDSYGRPQRIYYLNRDSLSLLVMGFTGKKALEWKLKYIVAFNAMEKQLREQNACSYMITDPVERALKWAEEQKAHRH